MGAENLRIKQALRWLESMTEETPSSSSPRPNSSIAATTSPTRRRLPHPPATPSPGPSPGLPSVMLLVRNSTRMRLRLTTQWYEHGECAPGANPSSLASLAPGKVGTFHVHSTSSSTNNSNTGARAGVEGALVLCNDADYTQRLIVLFSNLSELSAAEDSTAEGGGKGTEASQADLDDPSCSSSSSSSSGCSFLATYSVDKSGAFCNRMYRELRARAKQAQEGPTVVEAEPAQRYAVASRMTSGTRAVLAVEIVDVASGSPGRWRSPFGRKGSAWRPASVAQTPVAA